MNENESEAGKAPATRDEEAVKETLAEQGIEFKPSGRFRGPPEPILDVDGILKYVVPDGTGKELLLKEMGGWKCLRCEHENIIPMSAEGKFLPPFECENDTCGRKGPFKAVFPIELAKPIWKLPNRPIEINSWELYVGIYLFYKKHLVLKEHEYHILTSWTLSTWLVDEFQSCPYLCLLAPKMSGKTQVFMALTELAYRAATVISVTPASLFRAIDLWNITLLVDEAERQITTKTETGQALYGCLNGGYKRGVFALRTESEGERFIPTPYEVFGFKAFAATRLFDETLESRSIVINMVKALPKSILIDTKEGAILRSKLLYWRYEHLGRIKLVMPDTKSGRLIEMYTPLLTIAKIVEDESPKEKQGKITETLKAELNKAEHGLEREDRATFEGEVVQAICEVRDKKGLSEDGAHGIFIKDILEEMGFGDLDGKERRSKTTRIGNALKIFGITTDRYTHGKAIPLEKENLDKIMELERRYLFPQTLESQCIPSGIHKGFIGDSSDSRRPENESSESFLLYREGNKSVENSESCLKDPPTPPRAERDSGIHFQHAEAMNPPNESLCIPSGIHPGENNPISRDSAGIHAAPTSGNESLERDSSGIHPGIQPVTPTPPAHDARDTPTPPAYTGEDPHSLTEEVLKNLPEEVERAVEESQTAKELEAAAKPMTPPKQTTAAEKSCLLEGPGSSLQPKHRFDMRGISQQMMYTIWAQPTNARAVEATLENMVNTGHAVDPTWTKAILRKIAEDALRERRWM